MSCLFQTIKSYFFKKVLKKTNYFNKSFRNVTIFVPNFHLHYQSYQTLYFQTSLRTNLFRSYYNTMINSNKDIDWNEKLTKEEYKVIREKHTEKPFTGEYCNFFPSSDGYFACRACMQPLYSSKSKFDSGCGWPAFDMCYQGSIKVEPDMSTGYLRQEIMCNNCGGHLGHVFHNEKLTNTSERHCVNSISITYVNGTLPNKSEGTIKDLIREKTLK